MVPQARLNFTTSLQSVRMPNNSEKKFYKDHVYESVTQSDTLFLSPFSFFLQFPEALMYCCFFFCLFDWFFIYPIIYWPHVTIHAAWVVQDEFFSAKCSKIYVYAVLFWVEAKKKKANWEETAPSSCRKENSGISAFLAKPHNGPLSN